MSTTAASPVGLPQRSSDAPRWFRRCVAAVMIMLPLFVALVFTVPLAAFVGLEVPSIIYVIFVVTFMPFYLLFGARALWREYFLLTVNGPLARGDAMRAGFWWAGAVPLLAAFGVIALLSVIGWFMPWPPAAHREWTGLRLFLWELAGATVFFMPFNGAAGLIGGPLGGLIAAWFLNRIDPRWRPAS
jgi:hypothetical protein